MAAVITYGAHRGAVVDAKWLFTAITGQAITTDAFATNIVDLGATRVDSDTPRDLGTGTPVRFAFVVTTAFAGGTSLKIAITAAEDAAQASELEIVASAVIPQASLTLGKVFYLTLPENMKLDRYVGITFDDTGAFTGGKIAAFVEAN